MRLCVLLSPGGQLHADRRVCTGGNITADGFRVDSLVNLLSPALLNELLRPALMRAGEKALQQALRKPLRLRLACIA